MELLVIPIFLVVGYFVYRSLAGEFQQRMGYFASAAAELGGEFEAPEGKTGGTPKLSYQSGAIEVYVSERRIRQDGGAMAGDQQLYTTYAVGYPAIGPDMVIKKSSVTKNIKKKLGQQDDVEIGEDSFDERFVIDATDEDAAAVRQVLTPDRRAAVEDVFDRHATARITSMAIFIDKLGPVKSSKELVATIRHLVGVAEVLTGPRN